MSKNNGKRRKAWRKEAADFNATWWQNVDPEHVLVRYGDQAAYLFSKPYTRKNRPAKPDTEEN